jgi:uncharacterized protein DUF5681
MSVSRKTPKATPRKKEQPANAHGRSKQPKPRLPVAYLFRKVANEEVTIEANGAKVRMTHWEALLRQLQIMAHKNSSAARLLHRIRKEFPGDGSPDVKSILVFTDNEMNY